ncbi:MAG: hypothetical protein ABI345_09880 [Jatrophihabitans sp.]
MPTLRLLSLTLSGSLDAAAAARAVAEVRPDVVSVHGAPSLLRWRSRSAQFARRCGLVVVGGGRTAGGNLLMSTLGVDVLGTSNLTFSGVRGPLAPGAAVAVLRRFGAGCTIAGARLGTPPDVRTDQLTQLRSAVADLVPDDLPAVLDLQGLDGDALTRLAQPLGLIVAAGGVLVDRRLTVVEATVTGHIVRVDLDLPT